MIAPESRPKLAAKARLKHDKASGRYLLLYPEKGLLLNATGTAIATLCTGEHSVAAIVSRLQQDHTDADRETIANEVLAFLGSLAERGLLDFEP